MSITDRGDIARPARHLIEALRTLALSGGPRWPAASRPAPDRCSAGAVRARPMR